MNWDDMRIFLSVARRESLTGAAAALGLDPATVGRRVRRLEQALDTPLFAKSPQGYAMTEAGQRLLAHAEAAEGAARAAAEETRGQGGGIAGQVRIGAPDGCANYLLPQVTARLMDDNPGLDVQVVALPRVFNLSKREADMAVAVSRPATGRLLAQKIADYRLHLAASDRYLAAAAPIRRREDLKAHPIVGYIPDMVFDKELDYLAEIGAGAPRLASNSVPVQLHWLRQGAGLGIVHDFALPFAPGVVKVLPGEIALTRTFWLVRHADDRRVDRLTRLAAALTEALRREIARLEALT